MAFLNQQEREALLNEIKDMKAGRIRGKVMRMDPKARLAYFRNVQEVNRWMTRYVLPTRGTQVTLVETLDRSKGKAEYKLVELIVEPTAENRL